MRVDRNKWLWQRTTSTILYMSLCLAAGRMGAAGLMIVENGEARAVIVVEAAPPKPVEEATAPKKKGSRSRGIEVGFPKRIGDPCAIMRTAVLPDLD